MQVQAASVSEVILSIKKLLESEYRDLTVVGEISNLSHSSAGHYYFNLSDENNSISCALFKMDALRNPAIRRIKDGDKVILRGPISVYGKRGTFQLITKRITPYGKGDLKAQFEFLKEKLRSEGLFDEDHKVKIPVLPKRVAVITALRGAALQDFLNVMKRRTLWHDITIIPSIVQGDDCPRSVVKAIDMAESKGEYDVLVITRGGGSMEDLWGFNDERLVRRAFNCKIPIISAIGHQVDFSLLDFVADLRCETPSAAAEILSQSQTQLKVRLNGAARELRAKMLEMNSIIEKRLQRINPMRFLHFVSEKKFRLEKKLENLKYRIDSDLTGAHDKAQFLDELIQRAESSIGSKLNESNNRLLIVDKMLKSLNPDRVLNRGYTYIKGEKDHVLTSLEEFEKLDKASTLEIHFKDGTGKVQKA